MNTKTFILLLTFIFHQFLTVAPLPGKPDMPIPCTDDTEGCEVYAEISVSGNPGCGSNSGSSNSRNGGACNGLSSRFNGNENDNVNQRVKPNGRRNGSQNGNPNETQGKSPLNQVVVVEADTDPADSRQAKVESKPNGKENTPIKDTSSSRSSAPSSSHTAAASPKKLNSNNNKLLGDDCSGNSTCTPCSSPCCDLDLTIHIAIDCLTPVGTNDSIGYNGSPTYCGSTGGSMSISSSSSNSNEVTNQFQTAASTKTPSGNEKLTDSGAASKDDTTQKKDETTDATSLAIVNRISISALFLMISTFVLYFA